MVLNASTGQWHTLNRTAAKFFDEPSKTGDIEKASDSFVSRYTSVPQDRIRRDLDELVAALAQRGLLEPTRQTSRDADGTMMALPVDLEPPPRRELLATLIAFPLAIVLLRLPFSLQTTVVGRLKATKPLPSIQQTMNALSAARRVGRHFPGRVACVELSLTAVLTISLLGHRADWCFGFTFDPNMFHAWVEIDGSPVVESADDPISFRYRRALRV